MVAKAYRIELVVEGKIVSADSLIENGAPLSP